MRTSIHAETHEKVAHLALKLVTNDESLAETLDVAESLLRDAAKFERRMAESLRGLDPRCTARANRMTAIADRIATFRADLDDGIA